MADTTGGFETETMENNVPKVEVVEKQTAKIEVKDDRGEKADALQTAEFKTKLEDDKVEEKLAQFENLVGKYTKQKVSEGLKVNVVYGPVGNGEVIDGVLSVNLPPQNEMDAVQNDERAKPFLDVLTKAGTTYKEYSLASASSTTMHESEHMIIDSRPGSQLDKDLEENTGIKNDENGHTLSLLDEGITYAFQMEKDSGNELFQKLEGNKPQAEESFTITTRKKLGEALREKVREYVDRGKQIDGEFLSFAGGEMKKLNVEKYVAVSKLERSLRSIDCRTEQGDNFEVREYDNPTVILESLVVEGYCFHGSSRKIEGNLEPQKAIDLIKTSGNEEAVYMTINPLLAEFAGIYGGVKGITKRENICHMEINDGKVSYPGESHFAVNDPDKAAKEGYIYVFDRKTSGFEEVNGEILSKRKIEPLMAIKIKREDFKPEVDKIGESTQMDVYTYRGEKIDGGNDFLVYDFVDGYVVKYPNNDREGNPVYDNMSESFYEHLVDDHKKISEIMGDNLAETTFYPPDRESGSNYRLVQPKFEKNEFLSSMTESDLNEFIVNHKPEFAELLEKAERAEEVFGVPLDLTPRNIVYHGDKCIIIENDCPSLRYEHREGMKEKIEKDRRTMSWLKELVK